MNSNRVKEIKKEDKKAFKSFIIIMIISAIAGGILGGMSIYFKWQLIRKSNWFYNEHTRSNYAFCQCGTFFISNNNKQYCL